MNDIELILNANISGSSKFVTVLFFSHGLSVLKIFAEG